jgi:tetratricopeptide (TPR) repeat protein
MNAKLRLFVALISFVGAVPLGAQSFYDIRFETGLAEFSQSQYASAIDPLRVAAFGYVDDIARYETAEIYLALAYDKLNRDGDARLAAAKVVQAEQIRPSYSSLSLPSPIRTTFNALLPGLISRDELAKIPAFAPLSTESVARRPASTKVPMPSKAPNVAVTVTEKGEKPEPPPSKPIPAAPVPNPPPAPVPLPPAIPIPLPVTPPPPSTPPSVIEQIAAADRMVASGNVVGARTELRRIVAMPNLQRDEQQSLARSLSQAALYAESSAQYRKTYPLKPGEESHMFYEAVNRYELGDYRLARDLITRALPALPKTPEILGYRDRILAHQ